MSPKFRKFIGWAVGCFMVLCAIGAMSISIWAVLLYIAAAMLALPPARRLCSQYTSKTLRPAARAISIFVLSSMAMYAVGSTSYEGFKEKSAEGRIDLVRHAQQEDEAKQRELETQKRQYAEGAEKIHDHIRKLIDDDSFDEAVKLVDSYSFAGDPKLKELRDKALASGQRHALLAKQFSSWDGSHRSLERHIKERMHNPDSYKHVETRYRDNGDHVYLSTTYRGTNGFGAVVTNQVIARATIDGELIEVLAD